MQVVPPHTFGTPPPPHVCGAVHVPQSISVPQPSFCCPHEALSCAQVSGVHGALPHLLGPPPPQKSGAVQLPQSTRFPHPSDCLPQSTPSSAQVLGIQVPESRLMVVSVFEPSLLVVESPLASPPASFFP